MSGHLSHQVSVLTFCSTHHGTTTTPPFPLGWNPWPPFLPLLCRWSRAQQVAGHYFRPGFISPFAKAAFPSPNLPAPCTAECTGRRTTWEQLHIRRTAWHGAGLPTLTDWLTNTALKAHASNPPESQNTPIEGSLGTYVSTAMNNNCCILGCMSGHVYE